MGVFMTGCLLFVVLHLITSPFSQTVGRLPIPTNTYQHCESSSLYTLGSLSAVPHGISPAVFLPQLDCLDLLGVPRSSYPNGRAPSSSGFIGGFAVARTMSSKKDVPGKQADSHDSNLKSSTSSTSSGQLKLSKAPPTTSTSAITAIASATTPSTSNQLLGPSVSASILSDKASLGSSNSFSSTPLPPAPTHSPNNSRSPSFPYLQQQQQQSSLAQESTHGREAIEILEATNAFPGDTQQDLEDALPAVNPISLFVTLPNGVSIRGDSVGGTGAYGNVGLSSCPGKKVRLDTGPVNGRAAINRDLDSDFARLASLNIKCVVCCLNDAELSYLGAPIPKYIAAAEKFRIAVVRIPIIEGSCPERLEDVVDVIDAIDAQLRQGVNVLIHCRGGVGRAGLIACCLLLKKKFVANAERAIQFVRIRRSLKAIETMRQEDFITAYEQRLREGEKRNVHSSPA
ncbi:protein-tyrosine phosphatase-like protein [Chytriomyces cf. hyalinus JEL632]|nr:protein-tyrosine phosphatase-like protein [Chytriomyces cf. hyalinus JEL632]